MRICWQIYDKANYFGGPVINAIRLLPQLQEMGYEIIAIVGHDKSGHPNADFLEMQGIKCFKYTIPKYSEAHTKIFIKTLIKFKPDIFVSNISVQAGFAGKWAQKWGIPVVHTHRSYDTLNSGTADFFFTGPTEWRLNALVCVNKYLEYKVKSKKGSGFLSKVIPSGVPIPDYFAEQKSDGLIKIVYSGRLAQKQKRVDDMLNSFIAIAKKKGNVIFTLIGDGKKTFVDKLKDQVIKTELSERIKFIGNFRGDEYKEELSKHQIIVLLSDYEGTPGSIMDGMSCGLVPVVSNINGIGELVKHRKNGIVINNRKESFHKAIHELSENQELRKALSTSARNTIINSFSLDRTAYLWDELFKEILPTKIKKNPMKYPATISLPTENDLLVQHRSKPTFTKRIVSAIKKSMI